MRIGLLLACGTLLAQPSTFDVASIHPGRPPVGEGRLREPVAITRSGVSIRYATVRDCIEWAYRVKPFQIAGPDWTTADRFDIVAKAAGPTASDPLRRMLQALLAERFHLRLHHEIRQLPVYALVPAKNGPKLRESKYETSEMRKLPGGGLRLEFRRTSLAQLADFLSGLAAIDRPVRDRSGLAGVYDFPLDLHEVAGPWTSDAERQAAPSMSTVLQEQLGLKFAPRKDATDVLVIDHVERPSVE